MRNLNHFEYLAPRILRWRLDFFFNLRADGIGRPLILEKLFEKQECVNSSVFIKL